MPDIPVRVSRVVSEGDHRAFCALPYALYRDDPLWVPPLRVQERRRWSVARNPSLATRWTERFLAHCGGQVVGRIAAVIDPEFQRRWEPDGGFFGFFECVPDAVVARALLSAAESALAGRGVRHVFGPVNLTTNDEVGLLVDGFDSRPMILSPYNPPGYQDLLTGAGYQPQTDYHAFEWTHTRLVSPAVERLVRSIDRSGVRIRASDPRRFEQECRQMLDIYNRAFGEVWGSVPLSKAEFAQRAAEFRQFYRPELAVFADIGDQVVGFGLALPDINEALATLNGRLLPFGWLRLAYAIPRIRTLRCMLIGVLPGYTGRGIAALISHAIDAAGRALGVELAELSLVQDGNQRVRHVIEAFGGRPVKTFRLYHRLLGAS